MNGFAGYPWDDHGPLRVSENKRYLQHEDGTPFLWIGCTPWGLFQRINREDVNDYLADRRAKGFSVVQAVAFWFPHGGGVSDRLHNAENAYGHRPFLGDPENPDTAQPLVRPGGSLTHPNDYWDHADYVVEAVKDHGMFLCLLPCWGRAYITGRQGGKIEMDEIEAKAYGEFLGRRYKDEKHILWALGGDAKTGSKVTGRFTDYRHVFRAMAEGIVRGATGAMISYNQQHPAWDQVLMTYHPGATRSSCHYFHGEAWLDINMYQTGQRNLSDVHEQITEGYNREYPVLPVINGEPSYEGYIGWAKVWRKGIDNRRLAHHTFFAGAGGFTYGNEMSAPNANDAIWAFGPGWKNNLNAEGAGDLKHLKKVFLDNHWWRLVPNQRIIVGGKSNGRTLKVAVTSCDKDRVLIYFPENSPADIDLTCIFAHNTANVTWHNPRNGKTVSAAAVSTSGIKRFDPPSAWQDALLVIVAQENAPPAIPETRQ
jgi:hypothetical protein